MAIPYAPQGGIGDLRVPNMPMFTPPAGGAQPGQYYASMQPAQPPGGTSASINPNVLSRPLQQSVTQPPTSAGPVVQSPLESLYSQYRASQAMQSAAPPTDVTPAPATTGRSSERVAPAPAPAPRRPQTAAPAAQPPQTGGIASLFGGVNNAVRAAAMRAMQEEAARATQGKMLALLGRGEDRMTAESLADIQARQEAPARQQMVDNLLALAAMRSQYSPWYRTGA